jgi:hypothetical protein
MHACTHTTSPQPASTNGHAGADLAALLLELKVDAGARASRPLAGAAAATAPRCGLCHGCMRGRPCAVSAAARAEERGAAEAAGAEAAAAAAAAGDAWDPPGATGRSVRVSANRAAQLAEEALVADYLRSMRAAGAAGPPQSVPLLRAAPPSGAVAAPARRGYAPPGLGGMDEAADLLAAAALADESCARELAVNPRQDALRACGVCMSTRHLATRCPALRALGAAQPAEDGDGVDEGGGGGGGVEGDDWVDRLGEGDLGVLAAVRGALDQIAGSDRGRGGGGGGGGNGGSGGGTGSGGVVDARALLAVAVLLQEGAREALAAAEARGGLLAG